MNIELCQKSCTFSLGENFCQRLSATRFGPVSGPQFGHDSCRDGRAGPPQVGPVHHEWRREATRCSPRKSTSRFPTFFTLSTVVTFSSRILFHGDACSALIHNHSCFSDLGCGFLEWAPEDAISVLHPAFY